METKKHRIAHTTLTNTNDKSDECDRHLDTQPKKKKMSMLDLNGLDLYKKADL